MATHLGAVSGDVRRGGTLSPRPPKTRDNKASIPCRNIPIYGFCRYEPDGCPYNHDLSSLQQRNTPPPNANENVRRGFNVDSPAFKPLQSTTNGTQSVPRSTTISPKSANAAPFTPKTNKAQLAATSSAFQPKESAAPWVPQDFPDFVPGAFEQNHSLSQSDSAAAAANLLGYSDPFSALSLSSGVPSIGASHPTAQANPYANDASGIGSAAFYGATSNFLQPAQYHLYAPIGANRERLQGYQRLVYDLFIPQDIREDLQRKAEVSLHTLPSSTLPATVEHFHSLLPLDSHNNRNTAMFGYPTWIYKATSLEDGRTYCLRRVEGFRLTNEAAIQAGRQWKQVLSSSVVTVHDAFTTRAFGDSSLIIVTDYHPCSKTVSERYFGYSAHKPLARPLNNFVREDVLWAYIVQVATALRAIHSCQLAVQSIHPTKVLITSKNRIRLNGCGIADIVRYDQQRPLEELRQEDFVQFGKLILCIASSNANATLNMEKALANLARLQYGVPLKQTINWLLNPPQPGSTKDIETLLRNISVESTRVLDSTLMADDQLTSYLSAEVENGRLVRLMAKLGLINERPEFEHNAQWSETSERYYLKLFRDFVFHQVDANGAPLTDLAHIISSLNKLDAGSEEKITLTSRDEQTCLVVSYKELKQGMERAFGELTKGQRR